MWSDYHKYRKDKSTDEIKLQSSEKVKETGEDEYKYLRILDKKLKISSGISVSVR